MSSWWCHPQPATTTPPKSLVQTCECLDDTSNTIFRITTTTQYDNNDTMDLDSNESDTSSLTNDDTHTHTHTHAHGTSLLLHSEFAGEFAFAQSSWEAKRVSNHSNHSSFDFDNDDNEDDDDGDDFEDSYSDNNSAHNSACGGASLVFSPSLHQIEHQQHLLLPDCGFLSHAHNNNNKTIANKTNTNNKINPNPFDALPDDAVVHVMHLLGTADLATMMGVCKRFRALGCDADRFLWGAIAKRRWPAGCPPPQQKQRHQQKHQQGQSWRCHVGEGVSRELAWKNEANFPIIARIGGLEGEEVIFFRVDSETQTLVTISHRGRVVCWDVPSLEVKCVLMPGLLSTEQEQQLHGMPTRLGVFRGLVAVGMDSGEVAVFDTATATQICVLPPHPQLATPPPPLCGVCFVAHSQQLVVCYNPSLVVRWELTDGTNERGRRMVSFRAVGVSDMCPRMSAPHQGDHNHSSSNNSNNDVFCVVGAGGVQEGSGCECGVVVCTHASGCVSVWDSDAGRVGYFGAHGEVCCRACIPRREGQGRVGGAESCVVDQQGKRGCVCGGVLLTSSLDGTMSLWSLGSGQCLDSVSLDCAVVAMSSGACGMEWVAIVGVDRSTLSCVNSLQIWSTRGNKLTLVRSIPHPPTQVSRASGCCYFDGVRLLYGCQSPSNYGNPSQGSLFAVTINEM